MTQVPFKISETHAGFGRSEGLLQLRHDQLGFEFQNTVAGILKSSIKTISIPIAEVSDIAFHRKLFRAFITIRFKSLKHVQDFPKAEGAEIRIQIARSDRNQAEELVKEAKLTMINEALDEMLERPDDPRDHG